MKTRPITFLFTFFLIGSFLCESCKKDEDKTKVSTVITNAASNITNSSATIGGTVIDDGGEAVNARGVCYDTVPNLNILDSPSIDCGYGTGTFECSPAALNPTTLYYYKAYAINSNGIAYGEQMTFTTLGR